VKIVAAKIICENPSMHPKRTGKIGTYFFLKMYPFLCEHDGRAREKNVLAGGAFLDNLF